MYLRCTNCDQYYETDSYMNLQPGDPCPHCASDEDGWREYRGELCEWTTDIYVNVYLVDQAFGGHQEGGWYYRTGVPVESRCYDSMTEAKQALGELATKYRNLNKGRRPISSVLSTGQYQVQLETHFAQPWPQCKPHYE